MDVFIRLALEIEAADFFRAHAKQGEPAIVIGVNQFLGRGGCIRQNAKPPEGIDPLVLDKNAGGNAGPAYAMEPVASGNKIAGQLARFLIFLISYVSFRACRL